MLQIILIILGLSAFISLWPFSLLLLLVPGIYMLNTSHSEKPVTNNQPVVVKRPAIKKRKFYNHSNYIHERITITYKW